MLTRGTVFTMDKTTNVIVLAYLLFGLGIFVVLEFLLGVPVAKGDAVPVENLVKYFGKIVPFVLALYLSLSISRWWILRTGALGSILDSLANTCMIFYCYFPDKVYAPMRNCVSHWGIASVYLLAGACREKEVIEDLVQNGLISGEEANILQLVTPFQRPQLLWGWILRVCYECWMLESNPQSAALASIASESRLRFSRERAL